MRDRSNTLATRCRLAFLAGALEEGRRINGNNPPAAVLLPIVAR